MNTWIVEYEVEHGHSILGYCGTLTYAKEFYERVELEFKTVSILKLKGDYFGEGYHQYRMRKINGNWKMERL